MSLKLIRRKGSDAWYVRGTVRGQTVFETTGTDNKEAANAIRVKREAQLLTDSIHGRKASVTFAEAALSYLSAGGSPRFLGNEVQGKWTGLIGHFFNRQLRSIGQHDLNEAARLLYPNTQYDTQNRQCFTPFIAVWNHAVANDWAEFRKWARPRKPKGTTLTRLKPVRAGTKPVTYERAADFVLAMSPAPAMVMTALFYTGLRPIELFSLSAEMVSLDGLWIALSNTKIGEPRGVPLHRFLAPLFTPLVKRGGILFRSPKGRPYPVRDQVSGQMKTAIAGARRRSGITNISPYSARHTVSTQLVVNGVHMHVKDQILGHAVDDMSRHYTDVPQEHLAVAINTLPIVARWADAAWMQDPLGMERRYVDGMGARNDLLRVQKTRKS
ncbi:tyrosine-type recombinase/integrase [Tardiphaga sp. 538_B7_N1_4]|uniref:tyrosine-type recombinase/integrase n=1 Tax=Tardiphaga sp. 538_B7_N1_4 TaxID=3240778 RepID=UPI003F27A37B